MFTISFRFRRSQSFETRTNRHWVPGVPKMRADPVLVQVHLDQAGHPNRLQLLQAPGRLDVWILVYRDSMAGLDPLVGLI